MHSPSGALVEAVHLFQSLSLAHVEILYVFGIGCGFFYEAARSWLHENPRRSLFFLEDRQEVLDFFTSTPLAETVLKDPQVEIHCIANFENDLSAIRSLAKQTCLEVYGFTALPAYAQHRLATYTLIQDLFSLEYAAASLISTELMQFGLPFFHNLYRNMPELPHSYDGSKLFQRFKGMPAIIAGAGSSLERDLPLIRQLENRAVVLAAGTGINLLSYAGIQPHFGVAIDPTPQTYHRLIMSRAFDLPIFYQNRLDHEALQAIHGPRLFLRGGTLYPTCAWLERKLGLNQPTISGGYSVLHSAIEIAYHLGCNPIFLTGVDLCLSAQSRYAPGLERHPLFPGGAEESTHLGEKIDVQNRKKESVKSYWPWLLEAEWIAIFAKTHPEISLLNTSEQGLSITGIPYLNLEEAAPLYFQQKWNVRKRVARAIEKAGKVEIEPRLIEAAFLSLIASFQKWIAHPTDAAENSAFQAVLDVFNSFFLETHQRDFRKINKETDEDKKKMQTQTLTEERLFFLGRVCAIQLKILQNLPPIKSQILPLMNPQPKSEIPYKEGLLHGTVRLYDPNGALKRELHFKENRREGIERSWYENGKLFTEVEYRANRAIWAKCWSDEGCLIKKLEDL